MNMKKSNQKVKTAMSDGIINSLIKTVNSAKNTAVSKFSDDYNIVDEVSFIDNGHIETISKQLTKQLQVINQEMLKSDSNKIELQKVKEDIEFQIVFNLSNNYENIQKCIELVGTHSFKHCLNGLTDYKNGNIESAFINMNKYLKTNSGIRFIDHYLVNKAYGTILANNNQEALAIKFLTIAVKLKPDDIDVHKILLHLHEKLNNTTEIKIEKEIIDLLTKGY